MEECDEEKQERASKVNGIDAAMTLAQIAKEMGVSRARVGQIEMVAMRKVRIKLAQWGYSLEDFFR